MEARSWSAYPIVPEPPIGTGAGEDRERRFAEVPESGWHALVTWAIGPDHVVRCLDLRPPEPVRVVYGRKGRRTVQVEERTRGDRSAVDAQIHDYLTDARVPSQPCGYRWFVELPDGVDDGDQLFGRFRAGLLDIPAGHRPSRERDAMIAAAEALYGAAPRRRPEQPPDD
ncbi:DUF5956 family protein [Marinactinospora thermotolerans]|uniref:Uncharacterized protein n=1 Tax=Marinactinospora thermotolerans DSM 45154 TaxID=1122192 RepID=A0A1T4KJX2_9ACTN|nr:DUF5956 family protein [Marinactinospora thermotolerans]SJZ42685.1 hypothetical protein SAMN02745673_00412 [Marinactinospora thermotolerans DSM 45154]